MGVEYQETHGPSLSKYCSILDTHYVNLQVIVVNDGSTDATDEKVCAFVRQHKDVEAGLSASKSHKGIAKPYADLVYIKLENGGKSRAMNKALKFVDGDIVVTIDGDSAMDKRAIEEIVACFETDRMIGAVGGDIIVANRSKPVGVVQQWEYLTGAYIEPHCTFATSSPKVSQLLLAFCL